MADKQPKKSRTIRQQAESSKVKSEKPRKLKGALGKVTHPVKKVASAGKKEYYIPMPDNKAGKFLNKRRRFLPKYFRESWAELKQVTWPDRKQTFKLTVAVFIFAFFFGLLIAVVDYGLDKLFKEILL